MPDINLGSYVAVPAGVTLDYSTIAMQHQRALSVKVLDNAAPRPTPQAAHVPCLFYLSPFSYLSLTLGS